MNRSILVDTRLGVVAQRLRERIELFHIARRSPENLGTFANDLIARMLLERLCRDGRGFVDVGAHIGSVIDGVRRNSRPSRVIAVEAMPDKAEALKRKFPSIALHCCAVGEADGELPFFIDVRQSGYSSLYPGDAGSGELKEIRVAMRRLDDLIGAEPVDVVKIDVEGAELGVLRGAEAVIARDRPTIMFESGPQEVGGYTKPAMWAWFDAQDYALLVPNRVGHNDDGLTMEGFIESHLYPRRTTNYFGVARERRNEIRLRTRQVLGL